jgi:hypothetical protein
MVFRYCNHIICTCILVLAFLPLASYAQVRNAEFEIHKRGNLWETVRDNGLLGAPDPNNRFQNFPSLDWPGGPTLMNKDDQRHYRVAAGLWIGGKRSDGSVFLVENGPFQTVSQGTYQPLQKIENFVESPGYNPAEAEETIIARFTTTENLQVTRTSRVWSFRPYTNVIFFEYIIRNNGSQALSDVYVGFPNMLRPSYQDFIVHNGWGDDFNRADELVRFDATRRMIYTWDDTPSFDLPTDVGNYWAQVNELRTTGYAGYAVLYHDPVSDNSTQPAASLYAQLLNNERFLTGASSSATALYQLLNGEDTSLQAGDQDRLSPFMLLSVGPYNLAPGAEVKIIIGEAVNGLPESQAVLGLAAQPRLTAGLDSLRKTMDRAKALVDNNFRVGYVPPKAPDIQILPAPASQSISIFWDPVEDTWVNPLDPSIAFREYRVYRSSRSFNGPFQQLAIIRPSRAIDITSYYDAQNNRWLYNDRNISLGAQYYYAVSSVDARGVESWLTNRNETGVQAIREPSLNTLDVKVFPNPFRLSSGFPNRGQENDIIWTNLPAKCTIRLYTTSGELVTEIRHDNPNSGEAVWSQLSDARQRPAPGIYFWTVDSEVGNARGSLLIVK